MEKGWSSYRLQQEHITQEYLTAQGLGLLYPYFSDGILCLCNFYCILNNRMYHKMNRAQCFPEI